MAVIGKGQLTLHLRVSGLVPLHQAFSLSLLVPGERRLRLREEGASCLFWVWALYFRVSSTHSRKGSPQV